MLRLQNERTFKVRRNIEDKNCFQLYRFNQQRIEWMAVYFFEDSQETRGGAIRPLQKMQMVLRYVADPGFQTGVGEDLGVHQSTVSRHINSGMEAIVARVNDWIKFPVNHTDIRTAKDNWQTGYVMPATIGAIDCTHVRIDKPRGEFGDEFINRKGFPSINVQATCNSKYVFTSVDASYPGSVHDSRIFLNSDLYQYFIRSRTDCIILGDSGYRLFKFLMTPFKNPGNAMQLNYNKVHTKERVVIEQCFGQLKRRFPALRYGLRIPLDRIPRFIVCCFILHNIAKEFDDEEPEMEDNEDIEEPFGVALDEDPNEPSAREALQRRAEIADILFAQNL